jgi:hypothetical protein
MRAGDLVCSQGYFCVRFEEQKKEAEERGWLRLNISSMTLLLQEDCEL